MGIHEDIISAQKVVSVASCNFGSKDNFHNTSAVYKVTNERMRDYHKYLKNRKRILSVIASGDQILNSILDGTREVDAFDISVYPKYFMFLKIAAIKSLSREEYIDFFYESTDTSEKYDEMYDKIREHLKGEVKVFWDSLFDFFDWFDIYNSTLFSSEPYSTSYAVCQNKYLDNEEEYNKLRRVIDDVVIRTYDGNILDMYFDVSYDLVYLSNIIYYSDVNKYKNMLEKFKLNKDGIVLTYFYKVQEHIKDYFNGKEYVFDKISDSEATLMLYTKK